MLIQACSSGAQAAIPQEKAVSPEDVSESFYAWYLDYIGDPMQENFKNPVADLAYHDSEYLTESFIEHVDELVAGFSGASGYDPFLCAQAIPQEIYSGGAFVRGETASVVMKTDFPDHTFTVDLYRSADRWLIGSVTCGFSPDGTAKGFYTWYLAYIGDRASDNMRNPLVDKAYRDSGFLSPAFIERLDRLTEGGLPADPVLMAQDIPQDFSVDPGAAEGTAIVHLVFGTETIRHLQVDMVQELGNWKIDAIRLAE